MPCQSGGVNPLLSVLPLQRAAVVPRKEMLITRSHRVFSIQPPTSLKALDGKYSGNESRLCLEMVSFLQVSPLFFTVVGRGMNL